MRKLTALSVIALMLALASAGATSASYAHMNRSAASTYRAQAWYIISHTFPAATRYKAFAVARCETVNFTDFWNDRSHAKGLFQEMPGNHGRTLYWNGRRLTINWNAISSTRPDWYAARVALYQSYGGYRWGEWDCG